MERTDDDYVTTHPVATTLRLVHSRIAAGEALPFELFAADVVAPVREQAQAS